MPKGFLLPLNLSKVLAGLPVFPAADLEPAADFVKGFLPAKLLDFPAKLLPDFFAKPPLDLP